MTTGAGSYGRAELALACAPDEPRKRRRGPTDLRFAQPSESERSPAAGRGALSPS